MSQFVKGSILSGSAYNGYDSNIDFKIKSEFKSPSQFKSLHEGRTYFFTRLLEMMFRQLESRTSKNTSFNLIYIFFHFIQFIFYLFILLFFFRRRIQGASCRDGFRSGRRAFFWVFGCAERDPILGDPDGAGMRFDDVDDRALPVF